MKQSGVDIMPLSLRKDRAIAELKMYENITEILKVDKIPEEMKDLNIKEIIENLHYRKSFLEEISNADLDNIKPERIDKIEDRLLKSDEYFINLGQATPAAAPVPKKENAKITKGTDPRTLKLLQRREARKRQASFEFPQELGFRERRLSDPEKIMKVLEKKTIHLPNFKKLI